MRRCHPGTTGRKGTNMNGASVLAGIAGGALQTALNLCAARTCAGRTLCFRTPCPPCIDNEVRWPAPPVSAVKGRMGSVASPTPVATARVESSLHPAISTAAPIRILYRRYEVRGRLPAGAVYRGFLFPWPYLSRTNPPEQVKFVRPRAPVLVLTDCTLLTPGLRHFFRSGMNPNCSASQIGTAKIRIATKRSQVQVR